MPKQPRRTREQGHTAQQFGWQSDVGERGTSHASAVERQRATEHFGMDTTDSLEQTQMRSSQTLALGNRDDDGCTRVTGLMDRVA